MSPTSYQTAPPRGRIIAEVGCFVKQSRKAAEDSLRASHLPARAGEAEHKMTIRARACGSKVSCAGR
jgi:hypothetical protein